MHRTDIQAHQTMQAPRATIGRHALTPAPVRARRPAGAPRWRLLLALLSVALVACGGGGASDDTRADIACNPDSTDCAADYGHLYAFRAVPDDAQGPDVYTDNPAPRAGYTIVSTR